MNPLINNSMSFSDKQNILWNMIDPGDPYDIKKSLIAKLPGDRKMYMGDHLQLIVLFQGAEIERLIENLNEYQIKYKQVKKIELDKHSFEIQIKQLTELCESLDPLKNDNMRLKEFVGRQAAEIEMLKRQLEGIDQDLNMKYNQALEKIDDLFNEKNSLRGQLNATKTKMIAFERSKNREIEDLKYELNERKITQENEVADIKRKFNSDIVQLQGEVRRHKQKLQNQRITIDELRYTQQRLTEELEQYRIKISSSNSDNVIRDLQRKVETLSSEKDRLQGLLNQKSRENGQYRSQIESKEMTVERLNETIRSLENRITRQDEELRRSRRNDPSFVGDSPNRNRDQMFELRKKLEEYEEQIALISTENERLNSLVEMRNQKIRETEKKYTGLQQDYESLKYQYQQNSYNPSPTKSDIPTDTKRQDEVVGDLQRKNSFLTRENQKLKKRQETIVEEYENQIYRLTEQINYLRTQRPGPTPGPGPVVPKPKPKPVIDITKPLDPRPPVPIPNEPRPSTGTQNQIESLNHEVYELKRIIEQRQRDIIEYKQRITELRDAKFPPGGSSSGVHTTPIKNQEIRRRVGQLQTKNNSLTREVERISSILQTKQDQNNRLNIEISRLKKSILDIPQPTAVTNSKIDDRLRQENEQLRNKIVPFVNEVNRLNQVLKEKIQELVYFRNQNISLKNDMSSYERQILSNRRTIQQLQRDPGSQTAGDPTRILHQNQRLQMQIQRLEQELNVRTRQLQAALSKTVPNLNQIQHQAVNLKQQIVRLTEIIRRKEQDYLRIQGQYRQLQITFNGLKNDSGSNNQRLNFEFQARYNQLKDQLNQQMSKSANTERTLNNQIIQYKEQLINISNDIDNKLRTKDQQIANIRNSVQNETFQLNRKFKLLIEENEMLKNKDGTVLNELNERANAVNMLKQELERANNALNQHLEQIRNYERTYQELVPYKEQLESKIREQHSLIQLSQEKIPQLAGEIERLNANLINKVNECQELKRNINEFNNKYVEVIAQHERVTHAANLHNQQREQEIEQGIRQYEQVIVQLKRQLQQAQRNAQNINQQIEARVSAVTADRDRLNNALNAKNIEAQNIANQLNHAKGLLQNNAHQVERQRMQFQRQVNHLSSELERLTQTFNRKAEEERKGYLIEIERLNNSLRIKVEESQEWSNQNHLLTRKLEEVSLAYNQLLPEYEASRGRMSDFEQKFNRLAEEFQRLSFIINRQKEENAQLRNELGRFGNLQQMNKRLSSEIDRLNQAKQELEQDIAELRIRYADEAALQKRLNEQLSLFVVLFAEIESLRKRVADKERECEEVRRSSLAPFRV